MELEILIARFQQKDEMAFQKLYDMYSDNICGVIYTIVRDQALAQEIAQDVFVKVWTNAERYNSSKGRFFTWILNIARNAAIDKVRSKSFKQQKKNLVTDTFVDIVEESEDTISQRDSSKLKKLIIGLKQKCIQIIDLLYFKGYTQREAAEELKIPLGTIKTRNRNCISQLRSGMDS